MKRIALSLLPMTSIFSIKLLAAHSSYVIRTELPESKQSKDECSVALEKLHAMIKTCKHHRWPHRTVDENERFKTKTSMHHNSI